MPATAGYQAGLETNPSQWSYGIESTWGTIPATTFQAMRDTGDTVSGTKTRARPAEINPAYEASAAVTTQEAASGPVNFALSYGNIDDPISVCLGSDWQSLQAIAGIAGDITITTGTNILSSTLGTKFSAIALGQWIRLLGFTNAGNNGFWRVVARADNSHLTLAGTGTIVTETPAGAAAQVRASTILNGTQFKSLYLQQKLSTSLWWRYPGNFVSAFTLTGGVGAFLSGSFTNMAQQEMTAVTDGSTGGILAAPTGRAHDPISGFGGVLWNNAALAAAVDSFTVTATRDQAGADYGMGSSAAQGIHMGSMTVSGSLKMYLKDFTYYSLFKSETTAPLSIITKDPAGSTYVITLPVCALMNPKVERSGPNKVMYATFDLEGNPQATGGSIQLDRLAAS